VGAATPVKDLRRAFRLRLRPVAGAALALLLTACTTAPAERHERVAARAQLEPFWLAVPPFRLRGWRGGEPTPGSDLHVYLGGDGTPWVGGRRVAADPTPRTPLTLELLARDPAPARFLGRPCYHGTAERPPCTGALWTGARYGERVVAVLAAGLESIVAAERPGRLVLVGYSGGGTLAVLVAQRVPAVDVVVTVAANLDPPAWTAHHGYLPLAGSLDPLAGPGPRARVVHLSGGRDRVVPGALAARYRARFPDQPFVELEGFDHRCCWVDAWPGLLEDALARAR
jgi:pimeloyl-ACP methyl ester carboxylesterase